MPKPTTYEIVIRPCLRQNRDHGGFYSTAYGFGDPGDRHQVTATSFDQLDEIVAQLVADYDGPTAREQREGGLEGVQPQDEDYLDVSIRVPEIVRLPDDSADPAKLPLRNGGFGKKQRKPAGFDKRYSNGTYVRDERPIRRMLADNQFAIVKVVANGDTYEGFHLGTNDDVCRIECANGLMASLELSDISAVEILERAEVWS